MRAPSDRAGFKVDRVLLLLHDTHTTDRMPWAQERYVLAAPSTLVIPTPGRGSTKSNPEVAPSQRQAPRRGKAAMLSSTNTTQRDRQTALVRLPR